MNSNLRWAVPARTILSVSLALVGAAAGAQSLPGTGTGAESELARRLDQLAAELAAVKAELVQLRQVNAQAAAPAPVTPPASASASASAPAPAPAPAPAEVASAMASGPATVLTSYGEINYNRPTRASQNTVFDLRRFVLGYQHRVDERTKIVAELEVEHSVSSAGDPGEVAIEQAYVERQLNATYALRAGLFLMPIGLLNENHEPTAFYGVERNFVETAIIPSTWREGGVQFVGNYDNGLTAQGGISSSFDLNKWSHASPEDRKASPLGSIHQELALARGHDLAGFGALNWRGVPGLLLGGALFSGQATQAQAVVKARVTLWDVHARWTPGRWDLSALYTRGSISNTAALNAPLVGGTLIPKSFDGAYVQGAYKVWSQGDYALSPFVRLEQFNTASSYADLGPGLTPDAQPTERVATIGANFQFAPGIVLKADYQRMRVNPELNRFNLGLGWSF